MADQRAKHVAGRGEIDPYQWNDADVDGGRDKQQSQPFQFARPQDDFAGVQPSPSQVEYAAAQADEADDDRTGSGIDAGSSPADAVVEAETTTATPNAPVRSAVPASRLRP